jgi:hypothetical protein
VRVILMGDDLARATVLRAFVGEQLLRGTNVCVLSGSMASAGGVRKSIEGVYRGRLTALSITDNPSGARGELLVLDAVQSPDSTLNVELLMGRIRNALRTIKPVQVVALYLPAHEDGHVGPHFGSDHAAFVTNPPGIFSSRRAQYLRSVGLRRGEGVRAQWDPHAGPKGRS